jgi:antitoxin component YwqK of YwqJK toxin-antitoxin module
VDKKGTKKNGKLDGPYEWWQSKGQLNVKCFYVGGIEHGPYREYLSNGGLFKAGRYNMAEKCGEWIEGGGTRIYDPCPPDLADGP